MITKEGPAADKNEVGVSQIIITPLASDTLHKNLFQDIKEGKLGDVPQVVIVHPDGSQEEIYSKLNVRNQFLCSKHKCKCLYKTSFHLQAQRR